MLNQIVLEEILYRQAREEKLTEDPNVREMLRDSERSLLASQVMAKRMADSIKITPGDVETYYEANKEKYSEKGKAKIAHILVADQNKAEEVLKELKGGASFDELVIKHSTDEETKEAKGEIVDWVEREEMLPELGYSEEAITLVFQTAAGGREARASCR